MKTLYKKVLQDKNENDKIIAQAAQIIKNGGLVAFPTETVYGLGANALDAQAASKIYTAKGRPADNPLIVHISSIEMLYDIAEDISPHALSLAKSFWPGPLTIVLKKKAVVPDAITCGLDTVAIRMPNNITALSLIESAGVPIAAPSANSSSKPSPTMASHVLLDLDGKIDMIIDGGHTLHGLESTIIDLSGQDIPTNILRLLRPGVITIEMLMEVLGDVQISNNFQSEIPLAPGMKYKHYSPEASICIVKGSGEECSEYIKSKIDNINEAIITTDDYLQFYKEYKNLYSLGPTKRKDIVGENLFAILRQLDVDKIKAAYVHAFEEEGMGLAIMNRLIKAANGKLIDLSKNLSKYNENILFVCTGNTCRSPMAMAIFNDISKALNNYKAFSRGISVLPGSQISPNAVSALFEMGIGISNFVSKEISYSDVKNALIVLCMSANHKEYVKMAFSEFVEKIHTINEYAGNGNIDVLDPFGGDMECYRICARQIKDIVEKIIEKL